MLAMSNFCIAQTTASSELTDHVDGANQVLAELDDKALTCMNSFNLNLGEAAALLCDEFMRAIDGELMASYLDHCAVLKTWRDRFVEDSQQASNVLTDEDALKLMVAIEYSCGENALRKRTTHVVNAFNTLVKGTLLNQASSQSFDLRLSELEQQNRIARERRMLQNAIDTQRKQRERATQDQSRSIENELIRQQINKQCVLCD